MPTDVRIINIHEFLKVEPTGTVDFAHAKDFLKKIVLARGGSDKNILLDLRHTKKPPILSDRQIWELVEQVMKFFPDTFMHKLAIVDWKTSDAQKEEFFAYCASAKGFPTKFFISFEAAIDWLGEPLKRDQSVK